MARTHRFFTAQAATAEAAARRTQDDEKEQVSVHVEITGTSASIDIKGRNAGDMSWVVLATINANGVTNVVPMQEMTAEVTAITAATVDVAAWYR